jgi:hypothetical protein
VSERRVSKFCLERTREFAQLERVVVAGEMNDERIFCREMKGGEDRFAVVTFATDMLRV